MFSYLSIAGIVTTIDQKHPTPPSIFLSTNFKSPLVVLSAFTIVSGLINCNFFVLKLCTVHLIGNYLFETNFDHSTFLPFLIVAFSLSFSQFSKRKIHPNVESIGIKLLLLFFGFLFFKKCLKSTNLSPGGLTALKLNDFLISESISCSGLVVKSHISKSAQSLGFSKFSSMIDPNIVYEFGTIYAESEMLQKFKYRVADINENFDPAYWRVRRVISGITNINENNSNLQVKILMRTQATD